MAVVKEKVSEWEKSVGINRFFAVVDVKNTRGKKESLKFRTSLNKHVVVTTGWEGEK